MSNLTWEPEKLISSITAIVTLGRLAELDEATLARYAAAREEDYPGIPGDAWYAPYARWAMDCGILKWGVFPGDEVLSRGEFAPMLRRFIELQGIPMELPADGSRAEFTDQAAIDALGPDVDKSFQTLNAAGVFQGRKDGTMNPSGGTKRSHLAALLNRLSDFIQKYWTNRAQEEQSAG